jgi:iron complex outermembrane receptor protein
MMIVGMFIRRIALVAFAAIASPALAQNGALTGRVTDTDTKAGVSGAQVVALASSGSTAGGAVADEQGAFRIGALPAGTYTIVVTRIGYTPKRTPGVTIGAGQTVSLNFEVAGITASLNQVVVSSSRAPEKVLDAPASISVVSEAQIAARPSITAVEHLKNTPGIDISQGGLIQSNVVARGFNNIFSGSMLMLQDYRFAGVPSLRVNVPFLFTGSNEDVERIEVLLGPASALYGPNSANGVLHLITKSPFTSQGTTVTVDGGEQSVLRASLRHAQQLTERTAFKLSGEYLTGKDFQFVDPGEPGTFPAQAPAGRAGTPNTRNFNVEKYTFEGRFDVRPDANTEAVTTVAASSSPAPTARRKSRTGRTSRCSSASAAASSSRRRSRTSRTRATTPRPRRRARTCSAPASPSSTSRGCSPVRCSTASRSARPTSRTARTTRSRIRARATRSTGPTRTSMT